MKNRTRKIQVKFRLDEQEKEALNERFRMSGKHSMSEYLREISTEGYIFYQDTSHLENVPTLVRNISTSINQIAKRINATGNAYDEDITEIKERVDDIWQLLKSMQSKKH